MRRFLLYILLLLVSLSSLAQPSQMKHSIEIDASSFKPVNTDALTGVAIDKIELDNSLRPCARIKLKINRMTRADIENVQIKVVGGIHDVMKKVVAHEGNGLIIELTAKPQTRFYLHHDKYGDSNEVTLNLEGDKEYRLDAELCHLQSIVIETNLADADLYIDDTYQGKTDATKRITVENVLHGPHKIRVAKGESSKVLDVEVSSTSIHFVVNLPIADVSPQYLVLKVMPADAKVLINGKQQPYFERGVIHALLDPGTYSYTISAEDYHDENGKFVIADGKVERTIRLRPAYGWLAIDDYEEVRGAKVYINGKFIGTAPLKSDRLPSGEYNIRIDQKLYKPFEGKIVISDNEILDYAPTLVADFANVALNVDSNSDIYINNQWKGKGHWKGTLSTGTYTFEARKKNHHSASITQTITAEHRYQSYTIPSPTPIMGAVSINTTPTSANVYIDDKYAGTTPFESKLFEGRYKISIRKEGFDDVNQNVSVEEHQTYRLSPALVPNRASVLVKVEGDFDIYVDDEHRGKTEWSGIVGTGTHTFEARKEGYRTSTITKDITSEKSYQCITLPEPTPMYGTIKVTSCPSKSDVYIDKRFVGKTPLFYQALVGEHSVAVQKKRYPSITKSCVVNEGEVHKVKTSASALRLKNAYDNISYNWTAFNIGIFTEVACVGYDKKSSGVGVGLCCRMFDYAEHGCNLVTGVKYLSGFGQSYAIGIPIIVYGNWLYCFNDFSLSDRDPNGNFHLGGGFEPMLVKYTKDDTLSTNFWSESNPTWYVPLVISAGFGFRHHDFSLYINLSITASAAIGFRYTYFL